MMNVKYRITMPAIMTIIAACAILAKIEMGETGGIFSVVLCMGLIWIPTLMKKFLKINIPAIFEYTGLMQMFCCIALGSGLGFYYIFGAWDIIAHTVSGVLWSFGALWFLHTIGQKLNELMLMIYCFMFSTTTSVIWEFFEFFIDRIRAASDMQRAKYETTGVGGLMDTMVDLICNFVGCAIFFGIYVYDKKKNESKILESFENECGIIVEQPEISEIFDK
jgi:hypothetical protein